MSPAHSRRAVVFDFGAVLFRWQPLQLLQGVVPELAPGERQASALAASIFQSFVPDSDWARFDLGLVDETTLAQLIATRIGATPAQVRRVIEAIPAHLQAQEAVVALLRALQAQGHRLYYLSNMPQPYAVHLERTHAFLAEFEDGIFSARVGLMKPHAAIYELAEQRFGLHPPYTLFIDDHPENVQSACTRGWEAVHFTGAEACEAALRERGWLDVADPARGVGPQGA